MTSHDSCLGFSQNGDSHSDKNILCLLVAREGTVYRRCFTRIQLSMANCFVYCLILNLALCFALPEIGDRLGELLISHTMSLTRYFVYCIHSINTVLQVNIYVV